MRGLGAGAEYGNFQGDADPSGSFVNPNEGINDYGSLSGVSEWEAKVRLTLELPWQLRAGLYATHLTGERFTPVYTIDNRNHDFLAENGEFFSFRHFSNVNGEDVFLESRGSRELDDATLVDVHLDRLFRFDRLDLVIGFDVFNLLNDDAVDDVLESVNAQDPSDPTTLFGSTRSRVEPRTSRLYLSLRW